MRASDTAFYVTGGTLPRDTPSYVVRGADRDLLDGLRRGEFCYVLTSRQMGKSSLMVRTAERLKEQGDTVVVLDLTAVGQNLSAEQWYDGLLNLIGRQLGLEDELDDFWLGGGRLGPLQRWMQALREIVLPRCPGRLVVFVDEIDAVRSLPFSTDELFAAIRECYNRRAEDPALSRLAFCLLGVATPSDLIRDTRTTPFNIGRRIELDDFTAAEAAPLASRLPGGEGTLARVLHWTGGHPYLTQRLCRTIAEEGRLPNAADVDRVCADLFLSPRARSGDDNLLFVRERLLHGDADPAALLDLYARVRRGTPVRDDDTSRRIGVLRLSGIVRVAAGRLRVRNRIYEHVFDRLWITDHMPDAELRRQRAAYRKGRARAAAVATAVVTAMAVLAGIAWTQALHARRQSRRADQQRRAADEQRRRTAEYLYVSDMNWAYQALDEGNFLSAVELRNAHLGQEDLHGFEWRHLSERCRGDAIFTFPAQGGWVRSVAFSPDGKTLAAASNDGTIRLWGVAERSSLAVLSNRQQSPVLAAAFSPDGKTLAAGGEDGAVTLWRVSDRTRVLLGRQRGAVLSVAFSPDGKTLATGGEDAAVRLWSAAGGRAPAVILGEPSEQHKEAVNSVAFSPDGKTLATASDDLTVRLWDVARRRRTAVLDGHRSWVRSVAFSPDGKILASGSWDSTTILWSVADGRPRGQLRGHHGPINSVAFTRDGKLLATGSQDAAVKVWDVAARQERATLLGHRGRVWSVAFSPDGKTIASGSNDRTVKLWEAVPEGDVHGGHTQTVSFIAFSPGGARSGATQLLATGSRDKTVRLWDVSRGRSRVVGVLRGHEDWIWGVAFSPDGKILASAVGTESQPNRPGSTWLWDVAKKRRIAVLRGHRSGVSSVAFAPGGGVLATGSWDGTVKLWDVPTRTERPPLGSAGRLSPVWCVAFSPDGRLLAAGRKDGSVTLWSLTPGQEAKAVSFAAHDEVARCLAFSPDGKTLATGSWDKTIKLWDVSTLRDLSPPQPRATLKGHNATVRSIAFSPDGRTLASGSLDATVRLWSLTLKQEVATLRGSIDQRRSVAFSPDGTLLASGRWDGAVTLWRAAR